MGEGGLLLHLFTVACVLHYIVDSVLTRQPARHLTEGEEERLRPSEHDARFRKQISRTGGLVCSRANESEKEGLWSIFRPEACFANSKARFRVQRDIYFLPASWVCTSVCTCAGTVVKHLIDGAAAADDRKVSLSLVNNYCELRRRKHLAGAK